MTEAFHPQEQDFPNLREKLASLLTVPVRRVPLCTKEWTTMEQAPYDVVAVKGVLRYPFTREAWAETLDLMVADFAKFINKENEFRAYPVTLPPRRSDGVAIVDFKGLEFPFDLRVILMTETDAEGQILIKVFLTTLMGRL